MWINYVKDKGKTVRYGKLNWIALPSKQLIVDWITYGIKSLQEKPKLLYKSFLVTGINSNLNGTDDQMIGLEIDIKMMFNAEHDDKVFHGFTAQDISAATPNINKLQMTDIHFY